MKLEKLRMYWIAYWCWKHGPVSTIDSKGNPYFAYVALIRMGMYYQIMLVDEDIALLNGNGFKFILSEVRYAFDNPPAIQLTDCPKMLGMVS